MVSEAQKPTQAAAYFGTSGNLPVRSPVTFPVTQVKSVKRFQQQARPCIAHPTLPGGPSSVCNKFLSGAHVRRPGSFAGAEQP